MMAPTRCVDFSVGADTVICLGRGAYLDMANECHCHLLSPAPVNPDWFYLSGTGSPRYSSTKGH